MNQGRIQGDGEGGRRVAAPPNPPKPKFKNTDFVDMMLSEVLRDCSSDEISH